MGALGFSMNDYSVRQSPRVLRVLSLQPAVPGTIPPHESALHFEGGQSTAEGDKPFETSCQLEIQGRLKKRWITS